ncbi:GntR family transcriptional regulator [Fodinicola acaciae]|uniref:GntR family transcriptional regulator n=1 Tax=Fodinicola acaciae TaxID=2681555 RepID=UPI0013D5AA4E|nr:GntR family transcriptional regulator [Fodinicola acaciae]
MNTLQERIEDGTYPPGSMLPSESQLGDEFKVSRVTVVRALSILSQDGWIEAQHGRGRIVRGRPQTKVESLPGYITDSLDGNETDGVGAPLRVLETRRVHCPQRIASALQIPVGTPTVARRRISTVDELGPVELSTLYISVEHAADTDLEASAPLTSGILDHLRQRREVAFGHATETLSARTAAADEARALDIERRSPVLVALVVAYDRSNAPILALDTVYVPTRHVLETAYLLP